MNRNKFYLLYPIFTLFIDISSKAWGDPHLLQGRVLIPQGITCCCHRKDEQLPSFSDHIAPYKGRFIG